MSIVYDKLLKLPQSFRIALYNYNTCSKFQQLLSSCGLRIVTSEEVLKNACSVYIEILLFYARTHVILTY